MSKEHKCPERSRNEHREPLSKCRWKAETSLTDPLCGGQKTFLPAPSLLNDLRIAPFLPRQERAIGGQLRECVCCKAAVHFSHHNDSLFLESSNDVKRASRAALLSRSCSSSLCNVLSVADKPAISFSKLFTASVFFSACVVRKASSSDWSAIAKPTTKNKTNLPLSFRC